MEKEEEDDDGLDCGGGVVVELELMALLQNPRLIVSSDVVLQLELGLVLIGGLICNDKSGCAGKSSILYLSYIKGSKGTEERMSFL